MAHNVQLPDEYDRIDQDLAHFYVMEPSFLRRMIDKWGPRTDVERYELVAKDGRVRYTEPRPSVRAMDQLWLLKPVEHWLPDFSAIMTMDDAPAHYKPWGSVSKALVDIREGRPCKYLIHVQVCMNDILA